MRKTSLLTKSGSGIKLVACVLLILCLFAGLANTCQNETSSEPPESGGMPAGEDGAMLLPTSLQWPLIGTLNDRSIMLSFGDDWVHGYCDGLIKRHTGIDIAASSDDVVYAAEAGEIKWIGSTSSHPEWAYGIVIDHSGYTTVFWHVDPLVYIGDWVAKGEQIATVADLGADTHLHFGIRLVPYSDISIRGALPQAECGGDPAFPEYFINPELLDYVTLAEEPGESDPTESDGGLVKPGVPIEVEVYVHSDGRTTRFAITFFDEITVSEKIVFKESVMVPTTERGLPGYTLPEIAWEAMDGYVFVFIPYSIVNLGPREGFIRIGNNELKLDTGYYRDSRIAMFDIQNREILSLDKLQPGEEKNYEVIFEIPQGAIPQEWRGAILNNFTGVPVLEFCLELSHSS